jgi:sulfur carrier protein ThiS
MLVKVHLLPTRNERVQAEVAEGATVEDVVRAIGLLPDGWIAVRGDVPIPSDEPVRTGEELKLISVVSGG